jgi:hypothetical protein
LRGTRLEDQPLSIIANFSKCDLGENGPCRNCLRRFPRPKCIAEVVTKLEAISRTSVSVEEVVDNDIPTKQTANIPLGRKKNVANWSTDLTLTKSYRRLRNSSLNSTGGILTDLNLSILNPINTNPQNTECFYFCKHSDSQHQKRWHTELKLFSLPVGWSSSLLNRWKRCPSTLHQ